MAIWSGFLIQARLRLVIHESRRYKSELTVAQNALDKALTENRHLEARVDILEMSIKELTYAHQLRVEQLETEAAYHTVLRKRMIHGDNPHVAHPRD